MACLHASHHVDPHIYNAATDPFGQGGESLRGVVEVALFSTPIRSVLHLKPSLAKTLEACVIGSAC